MTKLEKKLLQLGYKAVNKKGYVKIYEKYVNYTAIIIKLIENKINECYVYEGNVVIYMQKTLDNLQLAFNTMQKDLEILKKCEEHEL